MELLLNIIRNKKLVSDGMLRSLFRQFEGMTQVVDGVLSYRRIDFKDIFEILPDAFLVKPAISRKEAVTLFAQALQDCRRENSLSEDALIKCATAIYKKSFAIPMVKFTLWTKFRATSMIHSGGFELHWGGVSIKSYSVLPDIFHKNDYFVNGVGRIYPDKPKGYGYVILACHERTEDRAVEKMMDALQIVMAIINLYDKRGVYTWISGRHWTEGRILLGPYQFVFKEEDFCGEDKIWYNSEYNDDVWARSPPAMADILRLIPFVTKAIEALEKHPTSGILVKALMLAQDGFAAPDPSLRLLRYWSALEQLYVEADARNGSNEKVIERAAFAEPEPELVRWKLEHIARLRNDYVHAGVADADLHDMCQFLRSLLERNLLHWIFKGNFIVHHGQLLKFVNLPKEKAALEELRQLVDRRLTYFPSSEDQNISS